MLQPWKCSRPAGLSSDPPGLVREVPARDRAPSNPNPSVITTCSLFYNPPHINHPSQAQSAESHQLLLCVNIWGFEEQQGIQQGYNSVCKVTYKSSYTFSSVSCLVFGRPEVIILHNLQKQVCTISLYFGINSCVVKFQPFSQLWFVSSLWVFLMHFKKLWCKDSAVYVLEESEFSALNQLPINFKKSRQANYILLLPYHSLGDLIGISLSVCGVLLRQAGGCIAPSKT